MNAVRRLQDRLQQTLALTQRSSHKTGTERANVGFQRQRCITRHANAPASHLLSQGFRFPRSTRFSEPQWGDFAGLMVPRPVHAAGPSHEEKELAWALIIESGHIPLRTRLGTCNRGHVPTFAMEAPYVDAKDHFPRPAQRLETHPGKQGLTELSLDH